MISRVFFGHSFKSFDDSVSAPSGFLSAGHFLNERLREAT